MLLNRLPVGRVASPHRAAGFAVTRHAGRLAVCPAIAGRAVSPAPQPVRFSRRKQSQDGNNLNAKSPQFRQRPRTKSPRNWSVGVSGVTKIRKILFGTMLLALAAIATHPLRAADLPARTYKAPPMMAPAPTSWSGCYVGAEGGGAWGSSRHVAAAAPFVGLPLTNNFGVSGGLVGGTIGCNAQFDSWVLGVENDISWTNVRGSAVDLAPFNPTI